MRGCQNGRTSRKVQLNDITKRDKSQDLPDGKDANQTDLLMTDGELRRLAELISIANYTDTTDVNGVAVILGCSASYVRHHIDVIPCEMKFGKRLVFSKKTIESLKDRIREEITRHAQGKRVAK